MLNKEEMERMERLKNKSGIAPKVPRRSTATAASDAQDTEDVRGPGSTASGSGTSSNSKRTVVRGMSFNISSADTMRLRVLELLSSQRFDTLMGLIIVVNSVTIGLELSSRLEGREMAGLDELEHFFLAAYVGELLLRFYAFRCKCLTDTAVIFDIVLVVSGVLVSWFMTPMGLTDSDGGLDSGVMVVLRTLRLMRLARTVRLLVKFRELWMLVRGFMNSASIMFYTIILLVIVLYVLACVGVEMVSMNDLAIGNNKTNLEPNAEFQAIVQSHFQTVSMTMMTLVQFICLDSIANIYKPLIELDPILMIYFMGTILVIGIVLMNIVTAVVVNSALEQAIQDKEAHQERQTEQKTKLLKELQKLFERMDTDASGQVSREEIMNISEADRQLLQNTLSINDHTEIFDALDIDGSGLLEIDEFCSGIWSVAMSSAPIEVKKIEKQVKILRDEIRQSHRNQASIHEAVMTMQRTLEQQTLAQQAMMQQLPTMSPTMIAPDKVTVEGRVNTADVPVGRVNHIGPREPLSVAGTDECALFAKSPSVASKFDLPAWAADFKLGLQQSSHEAINEVGPQRTLADATPHSVRKLVSGLQHLHGNIGTLLAEMGYGSKRTSASEVVLLDATDFSAESTSTSWADLSDSDQIPDFSAMLEVLHRLTRGQVHELARELNVSKPPPPDLAPQSCESGGSPSRQLL